jgi:geranylgeranyl reductase family protein
MAGIRTCDVIVVGGGPAGSSCARLLARSGLQVVVIDAARFPRDKVCAGWITPQVIDDLGIDVDEYRACRTFQPFTGFRIGVIGRNQVIDVDYGRIVSFGIRRCEFDEYLLRRSGAGLLLGRRVTQIRRSDGGWVVNETVRAPMLVGAGGHFCPVASWVNGCRPPQAGLVTAQEVETALVPHAGDGHVAPQAPELYFSEDCGGYGWAVRKKDFINVGFGLLAGRSLPKETSRFVAFLQDRGVVPQGLEWRWRGHAYLVRGSAGRRVIDAGLLTIGDAAGLAYPHSGEGIRPAVESGLMAARAILEADGRYTRARLASYVERVRARFGESDRQPSWLTALVPARVSSAVARQLLRSRFFVRNVVLDRWFLHNDEPSLRAAG